MCFFNDLPTLYMNDQVLVLPDFILISYVVLYIIE